MRNSSRVTVARRVQYAALPYRLRGRSRTEVMLVTSRETRRWIIPKGWPHKGKAPHHSAAREAFEEAGVVGTIKYGPALRQPCLQVPYIYDLLSQGHCQLVLGIRGLEGQLAVPIRLLLEHDHAFTPEEVKVLFDAFEDTLIALKLVDREDQLISQPPTPD